MKNTSLLDSVKDMFQCSDLRIKTAAEMKRMNPWATIAAIGGAYPVDVMSNSIGSGMVDMASLSKSLTNDPYIISEWRNWRREGHDVCGLI